MEPRQFMSVSGLPGRPVCSLPSSKSLAMSRILLYIYIVMYIYFILSLDQEYFCRSFAQGSYA